jgi:hypothetical protein
MLSQTAEYALRTVLYIAGHADEGPAMYSTVRRAYSAVWDSIVTPGMDPKDPVSAVRNLIS